MIPEELEEWADDFASFHARFAHLFGRREPRGQAAKYLRGLMAQVKRKNGWQLAEVVGDKTPDATQRLLYQARWDADAAREVLQQFIIERFADILSEARKYGLHLILAHQYIEQLDARIRAAILGNVGTIISFRVGAEDARYLAREFHPAFEETDLIKLPNFHVYLKLMIDGATSEPFSARTLPAPGRGMSYREEIISASRRRYARSRQEGEGELLRRFTASDRARNERLPI